MKKKKRQLNEELIEIFVRGCYENFANMNAKLMALIDALEKKQ